jgi:opacity protein-like surface antigen
MKGLPLGLLAALIWAGAAQAQDKHDLCAERPGLTTNECVIEAGHVQLETGLTDWTLDRQQGDRTDTILFGDSLVRVGVGNGLELRLGWTPFGHVRERQDGDVAVDHGIGDVTVGLKQNLIDAAKNGDRGLSLAFLPFATLPAGREPIGAGDWSAGAQMPIGYRFSKALKLEFTPLVEAAVDKDGSGRHLLYSGAAGLKFDLTEKVSLQSEIEVERDDDPDRQERGTQELAGFSVGMQPNDHSQIDLGTTVGLNRKAPDIELYAGFTRYF